MHKATGLRSADWNGSSDPFVRAFFEGHEILTQEDSTVKSETLDPNWNEALSMRVPTGRSYASTTDGGGSLPTLVVRVYDHDLVGRNDFLGELRIPPAEWAVVRSEASSHKLGLRVDEDGHEDSKFSHQITGDLELSFETRQVNIEDRGWVPAEYLGTRAPVSIPSYVQLSYTFPASLSVSRRNKSTQDNVMCQCAEVWGMGKALVRRRKRGTGRRTRCGVPILWGELFGCMTRADKDDRAQIAAARARYEKKSARVPAKDEQVFLAGTSAESRP